MNRQPSLDIGVIGLSTVDCAASVGSYHCGTMNPIDDLHVSSGGLGNALSALSGLGLKVGVCTRIGEDVFGRFLLARWNEFGVDTTAVTIDESKPTALSFVACNEGERTPFYAAGANAAFGLNDIPEAWLASCKCLLLFFAGALPSLDGQPMVCLLERCRELGVPIIVDTIDSAGTDYKWLWSYLPYANLVLNGVEAGRMTGESDPLKALDVLTAFQPTADHAGSFVAITRSNGVAFSLFSQGNWTHHDVPSPFAHMPVQNVIGAGDAFRAGLAAYICLNDKENSISTLDARACCSFAAATAYSYLNRQNDVCPFTVSDLNGLLGGIQR